MQVLKVLGETVFLHLRFAQARDSSNVMTLYRKPEKPLWFWTSHAQKAPIFMTDELGVILANPQIPFLGLFDDDDSDTVECEFLRGFPLYWVLLDVETTSRMRGYEKALRVLSRFEKLGMAVGVRVFREIHWDSPICWLPTPENLKFIQYEEGTAAREEFFNKDVFIREASRYVTKIPENLKSDRYGAMDDSSLKMATKAAPLIDGLLDNGGFSVMVTGPGVPAFLFANLLECALLSRGALFGSCWKVRKSVSMMTVIPPDRKKRFAKAHAEVTPYMDFSFEYACLNDGKFLELNAEEGLAMFKNALREHPVRVVIFDLPGLFTGKGQTRMAVFKEVLKYCATQEIGVILFLSGEPQKTLETALDPDRIVHIYTKKDSSSDYIVETTKIFGDSAPTFLLNLGPDKVQTSEATEEDLRLAVDRDSPHPVESGFEEGFFD